MKAEVFSGRGGCAASTDQTECNSGTRGSLALHSLRWPEDRSPSFTRQIAILAAKEFGDRLRSGWVIACVLVWLGATGLTSFFGLLQIGQIGMQGYERTVTTLLNLVQYLVPLLGLLLGFDLVVGEREEQTLRMMVASGVSRTRLLLGKFAGGCLTLAVPLALGFVIAGTVIGATAKDHAFGPFFKLALSALGMGVLFLAIGILISTFSHSRVQALVLALLAWCAAVFVFDLVALGLVVSTQSTMAAQEIEFVCDATHVNSAADLHSASDSAVNEPIRVQVAIESASLGWLAANPVDLFRAMNLPKQTGVRVAPLTVVATVSGWLAITLGLGAWKLRRTDL